MQSNGVEMHVAVRAKGSGGSVKVKEFGLNGMTYVEGKPDQPYTVILKNNTPDRLLFVLSVDGLDVVTGQPATSESNGYVLDGYSASEIPGWRISLKEVNQFVFKAKSGSYAAEMHGSDTDCGVIACRVFHELNPRPRPTYGSNILRSLGGTKKTAYEGHTSDASGQPPPSYSTCDVLGLDAVACASAGSTPDFNLGTGWGEVQSSVVNETQFRRGRLVTDMNVYYADAQSLERAGIALAKNAAIALPQGFRGFCQPPPRTT